MVSGVGLRRRGWLWVLLGLVGDRLRLRLGRSRLILVIVVTLLLLLPSVLSKDVGEVEA